MEAGIGFITGLINAKGSVAVVATSAELEESGKPHSYLAVWKERNGPSGKRIMMSLPSLPGTRTTLAL